MNRTKLSIAVILAIVFNINVFAQNKADSTSIPANTSMADYTAPKLYTISEINVRGINFMNKDILINETGLVSGDSIYVPGSKISKVISNLWAKGYFSDVQIAVDPIGIGNKANVNIYLKERPRIYTWQFNGVKKSEKTELTEALQIKRGSELSDYVIDKNKGIITNYFYKKGFLNTEVNVEIENDSTMANAVNLTFNVDKNSKVRIGDITFTGNEVFSDKKLASTLKKTKKKTWNFFKSSKFKEDEYEADKENILDFYNSQGYRNAILVKDSIYKINHKRIGIALTVEEGDKYFFRNISWIGNSVYKTEMLSQMLGIKNGDTYDRKTLNTRLGIGAETNPDDFSSVSSIYQNKGYLMSEIAPTEIVIGQDSIDLEIKISEGNPFTINEINISGNTRIDDEVIRRELSTHPGELYDRSLLMRTMRQLSQMQHFNPEAIMPNPVPISDNLVDIEWNLEEIAADKFEISGGWGADMFVGSIGVQLNNLALKDFLKRDKWTPYPQGQTQQMRIQAQTNGSYYNQFSLSVTDPWFGGKKPNSLTVSSHYSSENDAYYIGQKSNKYFRTVGVAVGLGRRLVWPDTYFTLYNELSYQSYNLKDWPSFVIENGTSNIFALKTIFGRNSVDQPIYPRTGSDFSVTVTLTPPYSLFDKKDYSNQDLTDNQRYGWIEYHKWEFKGQWFTPISKNNKLVLMAKAEMGLLGSYDENKLSPFEGFDVGGDGMSGYNVYGVDVIGLRGYENSSITPANNERSYARAYNKYTVELRYPLMLEPSSTIYALVFAEGGNAFSSWKEFDPLKLKRSLGGGIRLFLPIVGMIGFDMAYGFDRDSRGEKGGWQPHFMIGTQF